MISEILQFDLSTPKYQFVEHFFSVPYSNINVFIGIDGISLFFVLLTTFLIPICLLASWDSIKISVKEYNIAFLSNYAVKLFYCIFFKGKKLIFYIKRNIHKTLENK